MSASVSTRHVDLGPFSQVDARLRGRSCLVGLLHLQLSTEAHHVAGKLAWLLRLNYLDRLGLICGAASGKIADLATLRPELTPAGE